MVRIEDLVSPDAHPTQALLVVETSSASLTHDRTVRARVYAKAGIPEYWIVNLEDRCIEIFRDPDPAAARYRTTARCPATEMLASSAVPGLTVEAGTLFDW